MAENMNLEFDPEDVEKNKGMAILAYIIFFIPLLVARESKFAIYHANQGLNLLFLALAINLVGWIIPVLGWLLVIPLGNLLVLILVIIGIVNAAGGKTVPLPLIGKFELIKLA